MNGDDEISFKSTDRKLNILIPVYNEEDSVLFILTELNEVRKLLPEVQIIVINDGSEDRTAHILNNNRDLFDKLISLKLNMGKGWAIKEGLKAVREGYVLIQDADLEYSPNDIPRLWEIVLSHSAGVVASSRFNGPQVTRVHYFFHKIGNRFITLCFNLLHNTTFTDIYSGYLLFDSSLIDPDKLFFKRWGQQAEMLSMLVKSRCSVYEIPINYFGRTYAEGKKIRASSIFSVVFATVITRMRRVSIKQI